MPHSSPERRGWIILEAVFLRVLGRWLLYTFVGVLLLLMLLGGGGDLGSDNPKGSWRSIGLCFLGLLCVLGGLLVWWAHGQGGSLAAYWPGASIAAGIAWGFIVPLSWWSIAQDIKKKG